MSIKILNRNVDPIGFGLMGFTWRANPTPYDEAVQVMKRALEMGANFWNAGDFYGPPEANSLQLLAYYFTKYPEDGPKVVLSIKGGIGAAGADCSPSAIRQSLDNCLRVLENKVFISIYEPARVDPNVPIETTIATIAEYVQAGKIGGIGVSECNATTIRRAHAIHPIAAAEIELSLFSTEPLHNGIFSTCADLNIPIVAYSPLALGFLSGRIRSIDDLPPTDYRRHFPRFQPGVFDWNLKLVDELESLAEKKGATLPQVAIAWVRAQDQSRVPGHPVVVPIPGCTTVARVEENLHQGVEMSEEELEKINKVLEKIPVQGGRYGGYAATLMDL